jgi:hypothetical protein
VYYNLFYFVAEIETSGHCVGGKKKDVEKFGIVWYHSREIDSSLLRERYLHHLVSSFVLHK